MLFNFAAGYTYEETTDLHYLDVITLMVYSKTSFKEVLMTDVKTCAANSVKFVI
jgi:hypothetical protein